MTIVYCNISDVPNLSAALSPPVEIIPSDLLAPGHYQIIRNLEPYKFQSPVFDYHKRHLDKSKPSATLTG